MKNAWIVVFVTFLSGFTVGPSGTQCGENGDTYELDSYPREVNPSGKLVCPELTLVKYSGSIIRYSGTARVHPAFRERLKLMEEIAAETGVAVYGRAPKKIVQKGSYMCRRVRSIPGLISEHGMGNAIDIYGFEFGPLERGKDLPEGMPKRFRRGFEVELLKHWDSKTAIGQYHSKFLRMFAEKLVETGNVFRVLLGPAYPGHKNHFHFDCASYTLVSI